MVNIAFGQKIPLLQSHDFDVDSKTLRQHMSPDQKNKIQELYDIVYTKNYQDVVAHLDAIITFKHLNTNKNYTITINDSKKRFVLSKKTIWNQSHLSLLCMDWYRLPTGQELSALRCGYIALYNPTSYTIVQPDTRMSLSSSQYVQSLSDEFSFDETQTHATIQNINKPVYDFSDMSLLYLEYLLWDAVRKDIYTTRQTKNTQRYVHSTFWKIVVQSGFAPVWLSDTPTLANKQNKTVWYYRHVWDTLTFFAIAPCDIVVPNPNTSIQQDQWVSIWYTPENFIVWQTYPSSTFVHKHARPWQVIKVFLPQWYKIHPQQLVSSATMTWVIDGAAREYIDAYASPLLYFCPQE